MFILPDIIKLETNDLNIYTPLKAFNTTLKENINGELTLTFEIACKYYDEEAKELKDNHT